MSEGEVARRIGFRRPAELRALLAKRRAPEARTPRALLERRRECRRPAALDGAAQSLR